MPFDANLDQQIADFVAPYSMTRKKMFGGTCYVENNKMVCGVWKDFMIVRLGQEAAAEALKTPGARVFDITGKPRKGWVMIAHKDLADDAIPTWIGKARRFVDTVEK